MPRSGSGIYTLPPVYAAVPNTVIQATQHNTPMLDIQAALTNSIAADGQTPMTGNLKMGSKKITDLSPGTAAADAVRYDQVSDVINTAAYDFPSRAALVAAKAAGYMVDGNTVYVDGIPAIIDSTQTGTLSALNDLGVNGVRLASNIVSIRWWTEGMTTSATAKIAAANAYAIAHVGLNAMELMLDENLNIADPVTLGGNFNIAINTNAGRLQVIAGGTLASTPTLYAVAISGPTVIHQLGTVDCNHLCRGYSYYQIGHALVLNPRAERFLGHGHRTIDKCAGSTIFNATGFEWGPTEQTAGGFSVTQFNSFGMYLDTNDVRIVQAGVGYCMLPILLTANANGNQILGCHPFCSAPDTAPLRTDPIAIRNECTARVFIYDCYVDCGYIVDTTNTAVVSNVFFTDFRATMTQPYIRVSAGATPGADIYGSVAGTFNCAIGYYQGAYANIFSPATNFTHGLTKQVSQGTRNQSGGRWNYLIPSNGQTGYDVYYSKQGDITTAIETKFTPGAGADVSLTVINGEAWLARPVSPGRLYVGPTTDKSGIGSNVGDLRFFVNSVQTHIIQTAGHMLPGVDNTQNLGSGAFRYATVFAGTGAINTSDAREKQDISGLSDAERKVAVRVRGLIKKFRFKDAVAAKGGGRWHFGVIAQDVIAAFAAEGLDAMEYGAVCHDAWDASEAVFNEEGVLMREAVEAGDRYGVRYDELAFFIIGAMA